MTEERRTVLLDGEKVEYWVRESAEASEPRIDVGIHEIRVVLPSGEGVDPESLLVENAGWVMKKKAKFDQYRQSAPSRAFEEGETFPFLGEDHLLSVCEISRSEVTDGEIQLSAQRVRRSSIATELESLYRREARNFIERRVDEFAERVDVEPNRIEFRKQRTRWGSCSTTGTLSFNWRLIMAPPEVIDYVVVHELAHLRVAEHSRRFWTIVAEHVPDYPDRVRWLTENSARLIFDASDL